MWRSFSTNKRVRLPQLYERDNKVSRTAGTTSERERGNEMSKLLLDEDWCVEHYIYFNKDEGCATCQYEEEVSK